MGFLRRSQNLKKSSSYFWQERCVLCAQQLTCQKVDEDCFFKNVDMSYYTNFKKRILEKSERNHSTRLFTFKLKCWGQGVRSFFFQLKIISEIRQPLKVHTGVNQPTISRAQFKQHFDSSPTNPLWSWNVALLWSKFQGVSVTKNKH